MLRKVMTVVSYSILYKGPITERHIPLLNWFIKYCKEVVITDEYDMKAHTVNSWISCHGGWVSS